jgi:HK97 family phage prohead protease
MNTAMNNPNTCPACGQSIATRFGVGNLQTSTAPFGALELRDAPTAPAERRAFPVKEIRVVREEGKPTKIVGYAAVFGQLSQKLTTRSGKEFREKIAPGAFKRSLVGDGDIFALRDHDPHKILARRSAGTLLIQEDENGLVFEITPADTTLARDLMADIDSKNVRGMSFGFDEPEDSWEKAEDGTPVRTLNSVTLGEISATAYPAYPDTMVECRSAEAAIAKLEGRAIVEMQDSSLQYLCRCGLDAFRRAFDVASAIVQACGGMADATLEDADMTAADDAVASLVDLIAKARACKTALNALGAEDETDSADVAEDVADGEADRSVRARMLEMVKRGLLTAAQVRELEG